MRAYDDLLNEKDEGYFASMADILAGILFVFIIIAMTFALYAKNDANREKLTVAEKKHQDDLLRITTMRETLLKDIQQELVKQNIAADTAAGDGILRLPADVWFTPAQPVMSKNTDEGAARLATTLERYLPCLTQTPVKGRAESVVNCRHYAGVRLKTLGIELHVNGARGSLPAQRLSEARAVQFLGALLRGEPGLYTFSDPTGRPLLQARGFGANWPLSAPGGAENDRRNRRIDLRFDIVLPASL